LDPHHQLLPVGVKGEIVIGGAGLAEGYLNDPKLTAEKFIVHPWLPGERLYKTGDCGRYTADGRLEFLGRLDQQVKIRGHRIELGEIESRLRASALITDCAVAVKNRPDHEKILVAYYQSKQKLSVPRLRRELSAQLPDYLIPQHFVRLARMPMTSSGKIDLKALPDVPAAGSERRRSRVKPRTPTEKRLLPIWQEILGLSALNIRDDFFHLGGHSLSAVKILMKVQKVFKAEVSLPAFFMNPTIEGLARQIENAREPGRVVVCLRRGRKTGIPFFLIHGAGGEIRLFRELVAGLDRAQPFFAVRPENRPAGAAFQSIEALARRYLSEIKAVQPRPPYIIGGWSLGGLIACELGRLLQSQGAEVAGIILFDTHYAPRRSAGKKPAFYYLEKAKEEIRARERSIAAGARLDLESPEAGLLLDTLADHLRAEDRYLLKPLQAPLVFINPVEAAGTREQKNRLALWRKYAQAGLSVQRTPGNHFSMFQKKHGLKLGALIQQVIDGYTTKELRKAGRLPSKYLNLIDKKGAMFYT
jgi:thioesterase domain-containing protein/acyl carrier protein